jgi:hypothetical protein
MKNKKAIEVSKRIDAYIRGKLSQSEIDELWLIFLKNPHYYELFETELHLRNLIQKEKHSGGLITEKDHRTKRFIYWTLAAAACVLIVLTIQIYFTDSDPDLESLALNSIAYQEMAAGNVERSNDETVINIEAEMNHAMASAYMSREGEAIRMFKDLQASAVNESQKSRIEFNLAILHYNQSEFEIARNLFISVTESDAIDQIYIERSWWFLANTYLKLNDQAEAMEAILMVKFFDGINSRSASTLYEILENRGR